MNTTPIAMITSPLNRLTSQSPCASTTISSAIVPRRIALPCPSSYDQLPQYAPELFSLSEISPSDAPCFWQSAHWTRTLTTMGNSACKDHTMRHLLKVEEKTLVEKNAVEARMLEEDPLSLSSTATTDSLTALHVAAPYKRSDQPKATIHSSALLLADRSRLLLTDRDNCDTAGDAISDVFLGGIAKSTRSSVVIWMKKVVESMKWPVSVFFTAVHAMDYTLPSEIRMASGGRSGRGACKAEAVIPLLSVACVLVGVSSECEHRHLSKTRCFVGQVPNVSSVKEIICKELSVVSRLNRGSLLHKTPVDFVLYFIARLRMFDNQISAAEGTYSSLYNIVCHSQILVTSSGRHIGQISDREETLFNSEMLNSIINTTGDEATATPSAERILSAMLEVTVALSLTVFSDSLHRVVPASRLVALVMLHIMSLFCPGMQHGNVCAEMGRLMFCLDYTEDLAPLWPCLFNVYDLCLQGQANKAVRLSKCSSSSMLILEILSEGRAQHSLPSVCKL